MDDLALSFDTVGTQLAEAAAAPRRRSRGAYGIGAGDVAKLMLSMGRRPMDSAPAWLRKECEPMKRMGGHARFLLQKAGRVKRLKQGSAQQGGLDREAELFLAWSELVARSEGTGGLSLDGDSPMWAGALPDEFPPWSDKEVPRLCVRTDGWARTVDGKLVTLSLKCARYGIGRVAWWNGLDSAPWYYALQCQAEMAALNADHSLMVIGCGWIRDEDDPREDGDILVLRVDRDDEAIDEIRRCVTQGWAVIESLKAK